MLFLKELQLDHPSSRFLGIWSPLLLSCGDIPVHFPCRKSERIRKRISCCRTKRPLLNTAKLNLISFQRPEQKAFQQKPSLFLKGSSSTAKTDWNYLQVPRKGMREGRRGAWEPYRIESQGSPDNLRAQHQLWVIRQHGDVMIALPFKAHYLLFTPEESRNAYSQINSMDFWNPRETEQKLFISLPNNMTVIVPRAEDLWCS